MDYRINYLDISKGVAILLIVLGHTAIGSENIVIKWIYSFHLAIFFIIGGYIEANKSITSYNLKSKIKSKFKALMIPYFTFSILFLIVSYPLYDFSTSLLGWNLIYTLLLVSPSTLWFLPAYFIAELIFLLFIKIENIYLKFSLIGLSFIVPFAISLINYNIILLFFCRSFIAFGFICIGYSSKKIIEKLNITSAVILLIVSFVLCQFNSYVDLYRLKLGNILFYVVNGTIASYGVIAISKSLVRNKILEFWGKNTLIILGTHQLITRFTLKIINSSDVIFNILILILVMILEYPIIKLINKYFPWIIGKERQLISIKHTPQIKFK